MADTKKKSTAKKSTAKKGAAASAKKPTSTKKAPAKKAVTKNTAANTSKAAATKKAATTKKPVAKKAPAKKPESNAKHVSDTAKAAPADMWMNIAIAAGVVLVIIILVFGLVWVYKSTDSTSATDDTANMSDTTSGPVKLLIVEDPSCTTCQVDVFAEQVKANLIPDMEVEKVSFDSTQGDSIISELALKQVPAYLFSKSIDERDDWAADLAGAFIPVTVSGVDYYMLNPQFIPAKVMIEMPEVTDTAVVIGSDDAKVTIYEFSDYECPYCAIAEGNPELLAQFAAQSPGYQAPMPKIWDEYIDAGLVRLVFYNMPLESLHPNVRPAHLAALCANEQGEWRAFHEKLFADRSDWVDEADLNVKMKEYAVELGFDETQFNDCLDSKKYNSQIEEELALGMSYGVSGTPAFFVNKNFLSGAQDFETFKKIIDAELAKE